MNSDPRAPFITSVNENYGAMHSGSGDQHVSVIMPDLRRTPWRADGETEEWLAGVFVEPSNWQELVGRLRVDGQVTLIGPVGVGRQAAARRLLGTVRRAGDAPIRRPALTDEADHLPLADDVSPRGRLLFDLSDSDLEYRQRLLAELPGVLHVARRHGAFVVVVLPEHSARVADEWLRRAAVPLERPDPIKLVANHLRAFGVPGTLPDDLGAEFSTLLQESRPADLARLAWLVSQTVPADGPAAVDEQMLAAARSGFEEGRAVAEWMAIHPDGQQRSLLLAVAMFTGFPAETVHWTQRLLTETVELPGSETHELSAPGLGTRLDQIGAAVNDFGATTLPRYGWDEAVRRYFWVHFPGLREQFVRWVVVCGQSDVINGRRPGEPSRAGELIGRFVDVCIHVGRFDSALNVATRWATLEKPADRGVVLASTVLLDALDRPQQERRVRRACYDWARSPSTSPGLARAVVVATERGIAPRQPGQAVVRLDHLLRHGDSVVTTDAAAALSRLAAHDPLFQRRILARLGHPAVESLDRPGGRAAFRRVADPDRLATAPRDPVFLEEAAVRRDLVTGWGAVLRHDGPAEREPALHHWLAAYAEHSHDALLDVLVDACRQDFRLLGAVFGSARRWWADDPEHRRATLVHLERRIARSRAAAPGAGPGTPPDHGQNGAR